jgi:hypothetical protein
MYLNEVYNKVRAGKDLLDTFCIYNGLKQGEDLTLLPSTLLWNMLSGRSKNIRRTLIAEDISLLVFVDDVAMTVLQLTRRCHAFSCPKIDY